MDRQLGKRLKERFASEKGYLLVSTLFFMVFSGLFSHSMMQIASNHLVQLNQLSVAYQAKAALNISKCLLVQEIENENYPESGQISTSIGYVKISRSELKDKYQYHLILTTDNNLTYSKQFYIDFAEELEEDEEEDSIEDNKEEQDEPLNGQVIH